MKLSSRGRRALVMGVATLIGSLLPALPYGFLDRGPATAVAAAIVILCVAAIARIRSNTLNAGLATVAIFGGFDGLTCAISVVGVELWSNQPLHVILVSAAGLAGGGAVSMAAGEWLADRFGINHGIAYLQTITTLVVAASVGIALSIAAGAVG